MSSLGRNIELQSPGSSGVDEMDDAQSTLSSPSMYSNPSMRSTESTPTINAFLNELDNSQNQVIPGDSSSVEENENWEEQLESMAVESGSLNSVNLKLVQEEPEAETLVSRDMNTMRGPVLRKRPKFVLPNRGERPFPTNIEHFPVMLVGQTLILKNGEETEQENIISRDRDKATRFSRSLLRRKRRVTISGRTNNTPSPGPNAPLTPTRKFFSRAFSLRIPRKEVGKKLPGDSFDDSPSESTPELSGENMQNRRRSRPSTSFSGHLYGSYDFELNPEDYIAVEAAIRWADSKDSNDS